MQKVKMNILRVYAMEKGYLPFDLDCATTILFLQTISFRTRDRPFDRIKPSFNERNESSVVLLIQSRTEFTQAKSQS